MTPQEFLSQFDDVTGFSKKSLVLLFAYYLRKEQAKPEFNLSEIKRCFREALLNPPSNLAAILTQQIKGRTPVLIPGINKKYFSLSIYGFKEVEDALAKKSSSGPELNAFLSLAIPYLHRTIAKVTEEERRVFLAEAIACIGVEARRATIIMTWIAVIDHLYEYIIANKLTEFNNGLANRRDRYSTISIISKDDFTEIKDVIFIEVAKSADIISKDVRKILDEKLGIRNTCAHPSNVVIHDTKVVDFIEDLIDNVIVKYPL